MNKKGSLAIVLFMIGIVFFVLGLALAPALVDTTNEARDSNNLNCSSDLISNQDKAICYQVDTFPILYIGLLFGLGGIILGRIMLG